jgi:hypothetical protein
MTETTRYAIVADNLFDGTSVHENVAALIDGGRIKHVLPAGK